MNSKGFLFIISLFCLLQCSIVVNAATYQSIYSRCQDDQAGCIVLSFLKGYKKATQSPFTPGDQIECANDGSANQVCSYKSPGGGYVYCDGSDPVIVSNNGNKLTATYPGIVSQKVSTSGSGTSIFKVTCLVKG